MRRGAFEIEAVARLQAMMFVVVQPDFKFAAQDVEKFFAFVGIGLAAAAARLDAEEMRLHRGVAPGEEFHAHAFGGFENLTLRGMDDAGVFLGGLEERKDVGAVVAGDAAKRGDGGTHLAALERTEESYGDAGGAGYLGKRELATKAEAAEALSGGDGVFGGGRNHSLALEDVDDGGGVQAAGPAEEDGALQKPEVGFGVETIAALRALRGDEPEGLPCTERRGRDAHAAGDFADAQGALGLRFRRWRG